MITASDLLRLPCTPDLTGCGVACACRSLATGDPPKGSPTLDRLRRTVGAVAADLAFQRHLTGQGVPFKVLPAMPFSRQDRYDLSLGGHRCEIIPCLFTRREQCRHLQQNPALLLQAPALLPLDWFVGEGHRSDDLYLFAFLLGSIASAGDVPAAEGTDHPGCLIHPMPAAWAHPVQWQPLEDLAIKSECRDSITVEIGGMTAERKFASVTLELPPKVRLPVAGNLYSLAYVHASRLPDARIGLHSPVLGDTYLIPNHEWGNLWIDGLEALITGWLTHEEFRRKATVLKAGMRTLQYDRTRVKNLLVPLRELKPTAPLLSHVKKWAAEKALLAPAQPASGSESISPPGNDRAPEL
jgi:hypothetical protein